MPDRWRAYGEEIESRLLVGTARYPSPAVMLESIARSRTQIVTMGLRRQSPEAAGGACLWDLVKTSGCRILPNTAGCHTAKEAITLAEMSREIFETDWVKLEVIGDDYNLQPDVFELPKAAKQLVRLGFKVFPYATEDLVLCTKLRDLGCEVVMPWGSPIGTGKGLMNRYALEALRNRLPDTCLVIDAGLGLPSHAAAAMELGYDAVLINTAIARADQPPMMAEAMKDAVAAGRKAYLAHPAVQSELACPSTPVVGMPFWSTDASGKQPLNE